MAYSNNIISIIKYCIFEYNIATCTTIFDDYHQDDASKDGPETGAGKERDIDDTSTREKGSWTS